MADIFHHWPTAKRAGRACLSCRARKVKCDVEEQGQPCKNCQVDETICHVENSKRGRKPMIGMNPDNSGSRVKRSAASIVDENLPKFAHRPPSSLHAIHTMNWLPLHASEAHGVSHFEEVVTDPERLKDRCELAPSSHAIIVPSLFPLVKALLLHRLTYIALIVEANLPDVLDQRSLHPLVSLLQYRHINSILHDDISISHTISSLASSQVDAEELPPFIQPISMHLMPEDKMYLWNKGALQTPPPFLRDAIVLAYIRYVHPLLPLLDLSTFLDAIFGACPKKQISILIFQAVMFAAVGFVDLEIIQRAGLSNRKQVRKQFYDKVRLLYDFDVESDRLTNIQTLVLMAYYTETPGDSKGTWHWMGTATSLAYTLGLNRAFNYQGLDVRDIRLQRRIWWSCYIRDRLMALNLCRPMRIRDDEFDTPLLTQDDFDLDNLKTRSTFDTVGIDLAEVQKLAEISTKMVQLCRMIGCVLQLHFSVVPAPNYIPGLKDHTGRMNPMLFRKQHLPQIKDLTLLDEQLQTWFSQLPPAYIYRHSTISRLSTSKISTFHAAILNMIFLAVVSALHRPVLNHKNSDQFDEDNGLSSKRVFDAACHLAYIDHDLHESGLDCFLPTTIVPIQLPAVITVTCKLKSLTQERIGEHLNLILYCVRTLQTLEEVYVAADLTIIFVLDLMKRANVTTHIGDDSKLCGLTYMGRSCWLTSVSTEKDETTSSTNKIFLGREPLEVDSQNLSKASCSSPSGSAIFMGSDLLHARNLSTSANEDDFWQIFNPTMDFDMFDYFECTQEHSYQ